MITVGDIEIHLINESQIMSDAGGPFGLVPEPLWSRYYEHDNRYRVPMHHVCLLVHIDGKTVVVDTGNGHKVDDRRAAFMELTRPDGDLVEQLGAQGVTPDEVDLVINTHLHSDHCGGNTLFTDDRLVPTFPNAEYVVQRLEYADASFPNERTRGTYFEENFHPLFESGQMRLLDGDIEIMPGIRIVVTPGHTRAHTSVMFERGGEHALYVADMASFAIHFAKLAWMTAYDVEPLVTLETKRIWQRWALQHDALLIFEHDPKIRAGRLVEKDGKLRVEPEIEA